MDRRRPYLGVKRVVVSERLCRHPECSPYSGTVGLGGDRWICKKGTILGHEVRSPVVRPMSEPIENVVDRAARMGTLRGVERVEPAPPVSAPRPAEKGFSLRRVIARLFRRMRGS